MTTKVNHLRCVLMNVGHSPAMTESCKWHYLYNTSENLAPLLLPHKLSHLQPGQDSNTSLKSTVSAQFLLCLLSQVLGHKAAI